MNGTPATPGRALQAMLNDRSTSWTKIEKWLSTHHHSVLDNIEKLTAIDGLFRLPEIVNFLTPEQRKDLSGDLHRTIWSMSGDEGEIRPGDEVTLMLGDTLPEAHIPNVLLSDLFWDECNPKTFVYLPKAWRRPGTPGAEAYLRGLQPEQVRMLCDGERANLNLHAPYLKTIQQHVMGCHDAENCGYYHGPDHWARVKVRCAATSRAFGIDPLVPTIFALTHDSQRKSDGDDPQHGPRAAQWIQSERMGLFAFLDDTQIEELTRACELHSEGLTEDKAPTVMACWDADRLDLGRMGIRPAPEYLCGAYAKQMARLGVFAPIEDEDEEDSPDAPN